MKILDLQQGTKAWLEARAKHLTASEASAMMGAHPTVSRNDLLRAKFDGAEREISDYVREKIFDRGHEVEAQARPIAEKIIGEELYPATVVDDAGRLSASLDGATMSYKTIWECKQWNSDKAEQVENGECPECDYWQVCQQLRVTGAEKCLYMVTDGTEEGTRTCWVYPDIGDFIRLDAGWNQFEADLKEYEPTEDAPEAVGVKMADLPALQVEVEGKVLATNLEQFRDHALAVFGSINEDLQTDEDFATAEETVKWCKSVEDKLEFAKEQALAQTSSIDELFRTVDEIKETARQKRLALDKLVKSRKQAVRDEIRREAEDKLAIHVSQLQGRVSPAKVPFPDADFAGAMKGKRTIKSIRDAVDQVLANAKLEANAVADQIDANLRAYKELADGFDTLFPDLHQIALKQPDDFQATIKLRIAEHKEAEAKREQERKEAEERRQQAEREAEQRKADEQAHAALQQQAGHTNTQRSPATDPSPPEQTRPVADGAGTGQRTERVKVTATFVVDVPEGTSEDQIRASLNSKLTYAGFRSIQSIEVEKVRVELA